MQTTARGRLSRGSSANRGVVPREPPPAALPADAPAPHRPTAGLNPPSTAPTTESLPAGPPKSFVLLAARGPVPYSCAMSTPIEQLDAAPPVSPELRAKILADPNVEKMAAELGMSVDEFVNYIGYYLNNPDAEPAFLVVSDENLRKMGVEPPSAEAIEANVRATVETIKAGLSPSGFDAARKSAVNLPSSGGEVPATGSSDPGLEDAVKKGRIPPKG